MGGFSLQISLKKQESYSKKKKSCTKSEKLLEGLKVAPNLKSCSKVAEQLMDSLTLIKVLSTTKSECDQHKNAVFIS